MFHQMTQDARDALHAAAHAARTYGHKQVRPTHVIFGVLALTHTGASKALMASGIGPTQMQAWMAVNHDPATGRPTSGDFTPEVSSAIKSLMGLGRPLTPSDMVDAVLSHPDNELSHLLATSKTGAEEIRANLAKYATHTPDSADNAKVSNTGPRAAARVTPRTPKFCIDLTAKAEAGELDPVVGREDELNRMLKVLARRTKNNPVLVGDPGVGKTALAEALATRLLDGNVPKVLQDRKVMRVDLTALVAGAKLRGDFEERIQKLINEAVKYNHILFIDELHRIVGNGSDGGGANAAEPLKEALARGELTVLGATTVKEYRTRIAVDAALDRRFTQIDVPETTVEETTEILQRLEQRYGAHHGVTYTDEALAAAARLTDRHMTDRFNPDKAIDVIDEAGANLALRATLDPDTDMTVTQETIAETIAHLSGVPVAAVGVEARTQLLSLEHMIATRVVGQAEAVSAVSRAVRRRRSGLIGGVRPASFLFAGPTGVGKTELAKTLADVLFAGGTSGKGKLIRIDMGEFSSKHTVNRLFGAPPGYVGHEDGGQLTEAVRRHPSSVVLLDEVDKAHPDVFDALLQVLDDGHMTDGRGEEVNFADTVIIMTTNAGATQAARPSLGFLGNTDDDTAQLVKKAVKDMFRPEFLNRLDDIVVFNSLTTDLSRQIVDQMLADLVAAAASEGVTLRIDDDVCNKVIAEGTSREYGARPLRRAIERLITDPLADALLAGEVTELDVALNAVNDVIVCPATETVHA